MTTEKLQLQNEQAVLHHLQDFMVQQAEEIVRTLNLPKGEGLSKGRTQASKALEVAQSAGSLKVFVNWLRYQAGRERSADFWSRQAGTHPSLARALTVALGDLQQQIDQLWTEGTPQERRAATMKAATRLLGYFRRALIGADYLDAIMLDESGQATNQEKK